MSASNREVAHRLFAAEYDEATFSYSESDEERAPNYVVTPTGARVNRLFLVGVLTEVEQVSDDVLRARIADPTGAFVVYAGQYQPDEMAFLEAAEPPTFVAVTGKARTFSPDDSDRVFTSVRPESINEVDADARDRWTVQAAEATLARVATFRAALDLNLHGDALREALSGSGVPESPAAGIPLALERYGTTEHYLAAMADLAVDALALVAGTADEVTTASTPPGDAGDGTVDAAVLAGSVDDAVVDLEAPERADSGAATGDDSPEAAVPEGPTAEEPGVEKPGNEEPADEEPAGGAPTDESHAPEAESTTASDGTAESEDLGDFEPGGVSGDDESTEGDDGAVDDVSDGATDQVADAATGTAEDESPEDVLDEEERERIEEEYGTDFSTGTEVGDPGEADIEPEAGPIEPEGAGDETPSGEAAPDESDAEPGGETPGEDEAGTRTSATEGAADAPESSDSSAAADADETADPAETGDLDVEAAVLETMVDLDESGGADRKAVVAAVVDEHGVEPGAVEDAIQDALMAGKCYEPDDETVKPI